MLVRAGRTEDEDVWARCFDTPVEVHHRLTRARGGAVLDAVGETYHLIALCPSHHREADGALAYLSGLLLDGMMMRDGSSHYYTGTDEYLLAAYPRDRGEDWRVQGLAG